MVKLLFIFLIGLASCDQSKVETTTVYPEPGNIIVVKKDDKISLTEAQYMHLYIKAWKQGYDTREAVCVKGFPKELIKDVCKIKFNGDSMSARMAYQFYK